MENGEKPRFVTIGGNRFVMVGEFLLNIQPRALMDDGPRYRIARMGGRASLGTHPEAVQLEGQEDVLPTPSSEPELPENDA